MEKQRKRRIAIAGAGYVGLSNAVLLAQNNEVYAVDIVPERVEQINNKISPIADPEIETFLREKELDLTASLDAEEVYSKADYVLICTPTDYDEKNNCLNTSVVESTIELALKCNPKVVLVIKSTVPIGFTESIIEKTKYKRILFNPEFIRESKALYDNLHPSRIVVGMVKEDEEVRLLAEQFVQLLQEGAISEDIPTIFTGIAEAESIKLFSNSYLAMRVAFFNELDTFAEIKGLNTKAIIDGVCHDPRIGNDYNNPSFGFGGNCLPKDTMQLQKAFCDVPGELIRAIVDANTVRKDYIAKQIMRRVRQDIPPDETPCIGIYRLVMKSGSDNFRNSASLEIARRLKTLGAHVVIFEPFLGTIKEYDGYHVALDLERFCRETHLIVGNRVDKLKKAIYSRDVFNRD